VVSHVDGVGLAQSPPKLSSAFATSPAVAALAAAVPSVLRLHKEGQCVQT
jgi:hypothetical protein